MPFSKVGFSESALAAAQNIALVVFDVDGVLTDGKIVYTSAGDEIKAFHVQDGSACKLLQANGIEVAIITGRESTMVARRAAELGITHLYQGSERGSEAKKGKEPDYEHLLQRLALTDIQVACVGDDLADIPLLKRCGLGVSVPNGHPAAQQHAAHVTQRAGGQGVAAELAELLLRAKNKWPY